MSFVFVVPTEGFGRALKAEDGGAGGNGDDRGSCRRRLFKWRTRIGKLLINRQLVQHVGQGLSVHQAMLNGDVQELGGGSTRERIGEASVERIADPATVMLHAVERRPIGRLIVGKAAADGIDSEGEEAVEI